jgi:pimeloyl-ACP methyl ester carboxylesterase
VTTPSCPVQAGPVQASSAEPGTAQPDRYVTTKDHLRLAVFTDGDPAAPPVLLVHGYPDTHEVWDDVAAALADDHYVIRYDVRGHGASDIPIGLDSYKLPRLADDLFAVLDAVSPDRPADVAGHDWGSIQTWEAATDPRARDRFRSYTTISGPCLDHVGYWLRDRYLSASSERLAQAISQTVHSWYVWYFQLPVLPELSWRLWVTRAWPYLLKRLENVAPRPGHPAGTLGSDAISGISLYRANILPRLFRPRKRYAQVPVQLVTVTGDNYVTPALAGSDLDRWVPDLTRAAIEGKHWSVLDSRVAGLIRDFAAGPAGS